MKRLTLIAIGVLAFALPAFALNNRSAIASFGLDTNACTPASPCRSFTTAIAATNPGGEIIALDSAGYGPFTVTSAMTISGAPGVHAAITVTSGAGITVNAGTSDVVTLRNLVLIGAGGGDGIYDTQSEETRVLNCTIRGFTGHGVLMSYGHVTVDHCAILDLDFAIYLSGSNAAVTGLITNSLLENVAGTAVVCYLAATAQITNCTISRSAVGVYVASTIGTSVAAAISIESSTLSYNTVTCQTFASGTGNTATVYLAQNAISFTSTGMQSISGGTFKSFGNNRFVDVTTIGPLSPIGMQ